MSQHSSGISVVINTKNACQLVPHHRFEATLASVTFADELIIVDMQSTDDTVKISKKYTDKVFSFEDVGFVEPARNFAVSKASKAWVLIVDADEEIPPSLATKLQALAAGDATVDAYQIPRKNMVFGTWYHFAGWWPDHQLRFFKNGTISWSDKIHSVPEVKGKTDALAEREDLAIIHHNYQSISQFLERLDRYTTHEARQRVTKHTGPVQVVQVFEAELLSRLFKHEGIRGGMHGTSLSFLQSFYEVIVVLKQWEKAGFPEKYQQKSTVKALQQLTHNLQYWLDDYQIQGASGWKRSLLKIQRRFRI